MALNFQTNRGWTAGTISPAPEPVVALNQAGNTTGAPDFLQDAIDRLLEFQKSGGGTSGGGLPASLINAILNDPNGYLLAPALTAQAFGKGGTSTASGAGGSLSLAPIQNPLIGRGYYAQTTAQANYLQQQQEGLRASQMLQDKLLWNPNSGPTHDVGGQLTSYGRQQQQLRNMLSRGQGAYSAPAAAAPGWASAPMPGWG